MFLFLVLIIKNQKFQLKGFIILNKHSSLYLDSENKGRCDLRSLPITVNEAHLIVPSNGPYHAFIYPWF